MKRLSCRIYLLQQNQHHPSLWRENNEEEGSDQSTQSQPCGLRGRESLKNEQSSQPIPGWVRKEGLSSYLA